MIEYWTVITISLLTFIAAATAYINIKTWRLVIIVSSILILLVQSILSVPFEWAFGVLALFWIAQIFNVFRAVEGRYQTINTAKRVIKSGLLIALLTAVYLWMVINSPVDVVALSILLSGFIFVSGVYAFKSIKRNIVSLKSTNHLADTDLPTVSVLIPARDEDENLAECINSVLASDYSKLEIIVLDDCSQDKSSEIIKSFAQRGVRFIQGEEPKSDWLAKNQAYDTLAKSASGQWLVFMGVDTKTTQHTLRTLLEGLVSKRKSMACVMPDINSDNLDSLLMPLRTFWEAAVPNAIKRFPPSVSTFWAIKKDEYVSLGGIGAVSQSVLPERYFARKLALKDQYIFTNLDKSSGILTRKNLKDQKETSRRLLYPQLKKSYPTLLLITSFAILFIVELAYGFYELLDGGYLVLVVSIIGLIPIMISFYKFSKIQGFDNPIKRTVLLPYLLLRELGLVFHSAYLYEFSEVIWKGRNVCYPKLKVIPRLPKI